MGASVNIMMNSGIARLNVHKPKSSARIRENTLLKNPEHIHEPAATAA